MTLRQQRGYDLRKWKGPGGVRARVLARAGHRCEIGLPGCEGSARTVHLAPWLGGDHRLATVDNCLAACHRCHGRVDGGRARRKGRFFRRLRAIPVEGAAVDDLEGSHTTLAPRNSILTAVGRRQ